MKIGCLFKSLYLEKKTHYPISNLFLIVLLYIVEAKKGCKKKSLNILSLAAYLLNCNTMAMILTAVLEGPTPLATKHADTSLAVNTELHTPPLAVNTAMHTPPLAVNTAMHTPHLAVNTAMHTPPLAVNTTRHKSPLAANTARHTTLLAVNTVMHTPPLAVSTAMHTQPLALSTARHKPPLADNTARHTPSLAVNTTRHTPPKTVNTTDIKQNWLEIQLTNIYSNTGSTIDCTCMSQKPEGNYFALGNYLTTNMRYKSIQCKSIKSCIM